MKTFYLSYAVTVDILISGFTKHIITNARIQMFSVESVFLHKWLSMQTHKVTCGVSQKATCDNDTMLQCNYKT